jgi:hypothetical protein
MPYDRTMVWRGISDRPPECRLSASRIGSWQKNGAGHLQGKNGIAEDTYRDTWWMFIGSRSRSECAKLESWVG